MIVSAFISKLQEDLSKRDGIDNLKALTEASVLQYIKLVINLHNKINGHDQVKSLSFLKDIKKVEEVIGENYKESTQRSIYNSLASILYPYKEQKGFKNVFEFYYSKGKELNQKVDTQNKKGEKSNTQEENWISWEEVLEKRNELHADVEKIKVKKLITEKEHETLLKNVVLSLYTYLPPRRNEYQNLLIIPTNKELDEDKNYYVLDDKKIILNIYKTSKKRGIMELDICEELEEAINNYLQYHNLYKSNKKKKKDYEIPFLINRNNEPLTQVNSITRILNKVFKPKNIGATMLRHIYDTHYFKEPLIKMQEAADKMGHSVEMQQQYIKKD